MGRAKKVEGAPITKLQFKCNVLLNVYTHQEKLVICQVKRQSEKSNGFSEKCCCPLKIDQWKLFEEVLLRHLDAVSRLKSSQQKRQLGEWSSLPLDKDFQLAIRRSPLSSKIVCEYLLQEREVKSEDISWILECSITRNSSRNSQKLKLSISSAEDSSEYEPKKVHINTEIPSVIYKPSKKQTSSSSISFMKKEESEEKMEEASYSPKPINNNCNLVNDSNIMNNSNDKLIPEYKPAPITPKNKSIRDYLCKLKSNCPENPENLEASISSTLSEETKTTCKEKEKEKEKNIANIFLKCNNRDGKRKAINETDKKKEINGHKDDDDHNEYIPTKQKAKTENDPDGKDAGTPKYIPTPISTNKKQIQTDQAKELSNGEKTIDKRKERKERKMRKTDKESKTEKSSRRKSKCLSNSEKRNHRRSPGKGYFDNEMDEDSRQKAKQHEMYDVVEDDEYILDMEELTRINNEMKKKRSREQSSPPPPPSSPPPRVQQESTRSKKLQRELFGSDDDDDNNNNDIGCSSQMNNPSQSVTLAPVFVTPKSIKKSTTDDENSDKRRKRRSQYECKSEKRFLKQWLQGEKGGSFRSTPNHNSNDASLMETPEIVSSSTQILDNKCNRNQKETEMLERLKVAGQHLRFMERVLSTEVTTPTKVDFLSLNDLSGDELLDTFSVHQPTLDAIFRECRQRSNVQQYAGIDHCFVMNLVEQRHQMEMLHKLKEVYGKQKNSLHVTVYANALLPEWIMRIFMERYHLSREAAIERIQSQDIYRVYDEDTQSDTSLSCI